MESLLLRCWRGISIIPNLRICFIALFCLGLGLFVGEKSFAQTPTSPKDCKTGCTSNDVQIIAAYLSDINGNKLSNNFVCPQSGHATVYLTLELTTNTPRIGVVIYDSIRNFTGGVPGSLITVLTQCFGVALSNTAHKVTFSNPFDWTCGTPIIITGEFIGWGTGNTNFCTGNGFQCPGTSSKCYALPPGQFIAIETPVPQNQTVTQCSDQPGGTTSTFNLNNVTVTNSNNVTITWWANFTAPSTFSNQILTPASYSSVSKTVYAKITSNSDNTVFSVANVTLVVNQTPNLVITNPAAVCSPNTADITAAAVTTGSTLPTGTTLTYYLDNNNSAGTQITSAAAQTLGDGKYWIKATTNTTPVCSDTKSVTVTVKNTPAAPILSKVDNCDGTTTITAKDASNVNIPAAELTWSNGATTNPISVSTTTAITATRTVNGCISSSSNSVTPAPKTTPAAPVLSKVDNCDGTSTITAKDASNVNIPAGELTWSNGATTNPISVTTTAAVTATRTVNGCTSAASNSITPAPKTTPAAPVLSKVDNCNGTTTITAKDGSNVNIPAGELTWSNGATTNPINVTTTTAVTATRTVNGCTSGNSNSITPAPKTTPLKPDFTITQPSLCGPSTGTLTICQSASGFEYTIGATVKSGTGSSLSFTGLTAGSNPSLVVSYPGNVCPSGGFSCTDAISSCPGATTKATSTSETFNTEATVKAYPNPFSDKINFVVTTPVSGKASLDVYNMMGQKVRTIYQGFLSAGTQTFQMSSQKQQVSNLIYVLRIGDKKISGKILQINQ